MERKPPGQEKPIVPSRSETAKILDPRNEHVVAELAKEILGAVKPKPRMPELKVRMEPAHTLSEAARKARREKNRLKRTKPSQARTRGRGTWIGKAKEKHKSDRREG